MAWPHCMAVPVAEGFWAAACHYPQLADTRILIAVLDPAIRGEPLGGYIFKLTLSPHQCHQKCFHPEPNYPGPNDRQYEVEQTSVSAPALWTFYCSPGIMKKSSSSANLLVVTALTCLARSALCATYIRTSNLAGYQFLDAFTWQTIADPVHGRVCVYQSLRRFESRLRC